jgi:hypothetical protein
MRILLFCKGIEMPPGFLRRMGQEFLSVQKLAVREEIFNSLIIWFYLISPSALNLWSRGSAGLTGSGRKTKFIIHLPVIRETPDEFLAQWFHWGLGIFMNTVPAAQETFEQYYREISSIINENRFRNFEGMEDLIIRTRKTVEEISLRLSEGRDRLLEQHSFSPGRPRGW